jgi:hypothetical protein
MTDTAERIDAIPVLDRAPLRLTVTLEVTLYLALFVLALVLRVAELDTIPLGDAEAHEALAAWRWIHPEAPGTAPLATSPLMFLWNSLLMTLFGGSELMARLSTAMLGTLLVMLPTLFRREIGRLAALIAAGLLVFSPVALTASRTMSPAIWSMALLVVGLWSVWRFVDIRRPLDAVLATLCFGAVLLLADPAGYVALVSLLIGWIVAVRLSSDDAPDHLPWPRLREALAAWPWRDALWVTGLALALISTVLFMYPGGLSQVGSLLESGLAGLFNRPAGSPFVLPVLTVLVYEPVLVLLGIIGLIGALRDDSFVSRLLVGWLFGGLVVSLLYAGAEPAHGLWQVIPLVALSARTLAVFLEPIEDVYWDVPGWVLPGLALSVLALLFVTSTNLIWVARAPAEQHPGGRAGLAAAAPAAGWDVAAADRDSVFPGGQPVGIAGGMARLRGGGGAVPVGLWCGERVACRCDGC